MTIAQFPVPPIVKTVVVRAAPERVFALFTEDFARWWPLARVHTGPDPVECAIEPRVGGRVFERAADGRETPWGTVLAYDPPHRLAFSWIVELRAGAAGRDPLHGRRSRHQGRADTLRLGETRRRRSEAARTL